ncbi:hypothetical protein WJS89_02780 [Sphingomicrobium sp. XHP0235]|uniref:hypothetical protein n=1 Tax=Sphingomicrobium aquimarinum TaxID=3133971 RepID=UPI0031FEC39A
MAQPKAMLGAKWMSEADITAVLAKARSNREAQKRLLGSLGNKIEIRRAEIERSLDRVSPAKRAGTVNEVVGGYCAELKRNTVDKRLAYTREAQRIAERVASVAPHYKSSVQMLARENIGSERRSRIMEQIKSSGPAELASLAEYAAAKMDLELGAALNARIVDLPRDERPFSAGELADALVGMKFKTIAGALAEIERSVLEALQDDSAFEKGQADPTRKVQIAMMKRREQPAREYEE